MNISYLFKYLLQKKWLIIVPTVVAVLVSFILTRHMKTSYTSIAELSTGYMDLNPLDPNRNPNNTVLFNNVIQTLQSNHILDQVTYKLLLHDIQGQSPFHSPSNINRAHQIIAKYPGGKSGLEASLTNKIDSFYVLNLAINSDRMIRQLADIYAYSPEAILGKITIKRLGGSDFINVTSETEDSRLSAFIANSICNSFLSYYQAVQGQSSTSSLDTLKNLVNTRKMILDNKLKLIQGGTDLTMSNSIGLLGNLQGLLTQQRNNLISAQVGLDNINKMLTENGKKEGTSDNEEILNLRNNIDNLWAKYVNGGSTDANLLDQINKLRSTLQQKLSTSGTGSGGILVSDLARQKMDLEVKVNVAKQTMADLENKINALKGTVQSSASKEGVLSGLQNEVEVARQEYINANNLYNAALNRNIFPGNNFKQTLIASPPLNANSSSKTKVIGFSGMGVFCVIVFILLFIEFIDPSIKAPSYLRENVPLTLLASLQRTRIGKESSAKTIFSPKTTLSPSGKSYKEQIKQLRYQIEASGKKIFMVVSYHSGTGRTTLIQSLGTSLSLINKKILLIDSNFQNNSLSRKYNASSFLENFSPVGDVPSIKKMLSSILTDTDDDNIKLIACQGGDYTPNEILPEKNIFSILGEAYLDYDYILIDSAAVNKGPDSKELLKYTESIIILFSAENSLTEDDRNLVEFMKKENVNILGTVLNKVNSYSMNI